MRFFKKIKCFFLIALLFPLVTFSKNSQLSTLAEQLVNDIQEVKFEDDVSLLAAQDTWRELSIYFNQQWSLCGSMRQSSLFAVDYSESTLMQSLQSEAPNFQAIEYLLFGENNNRNFHPLSEAEITLLQSASTNFAHYLGAHPFKHCDNPAIEDSRAIINTIISQLESAMGDSIADANPTFLPEHRSWQTVESYFWRLVAIENTLKDDSNYLAKQEALEKQFIKVYRRLVGISYSQYLEGASALYKAKNNHEELADLIDHDDEVIALVNQIKSVSGRKKIQKFIDELHTLMALF